MLLCQWAFFYVAKRGFRLLLNILFGVCEKLFKIAGHLNKKRSAFSN